MDALDMFGLDGRVAVVAGGGGVLGGAIAEGFASAGASVAVASRTPDHVNVAVERITEAGGMAKGYMMDVFKKGSIEACCETICSDFGRVDILVNAVGGTPAAAATSSEQSFFDIPVEVTQHVIDLNLVSGTIVPCQVFGARMKDNEDGGSIINISSMSSLRPLTRVSGYSAAKAAVSNFTQWLAVHLAQEYSPKLRVNAIAPGFFLTELNRYLLTNEKTGELSERGRVVIAHTPMGEFGEPEDLVGAAIWLASNASSFVTGVVVPVDGGFSAFSGV
jgi:NAD(P)-dependent dehydrogenase (short-subunit alcohol dehydrogenase family)